MKRPMQFLREYKLLSLAVAAIIVGLILQLVHAFTALHWVLGSVAMLAALGLAWDLWQDVRVGHYGINILAITGIIFAVVLKQYWAAIVLVLVAAGSKVLQAYAKRQATSELTVWHTQAPQVATVVRKGKTLSVPVNDVRVGDKLVINSGETVPVDAVVTVGSANFDESLLTGDNAPQTKLLGDNLLSGSVALDGTVSAKATATEHDSHYRYSFRLLQATNGSHALFVRTAERYSLPFTFTALAIASAVWVVSGQAIRFLEVIVVATPAPLLLAAPLALMGGMARASRYGIFAKTGSAFERLAEAESIAFGMNGVLTSGDFGVEDVQLFGDHTKDEVLRLAASLEQTSSHAVAKAIVAAAQNKKLKLVKAKHVRVASSRGLQAVLQGHEIVAGRWTWLEAQGVTAPQSFKAASLKTTTVAVAVDGQLTGIITLASEAKPDAKSAIQRLKSLGLPKSLLLTGDSAAAANTFAKQLGIQAVHADALPADKLRTLDTIKDRPLVFVGDAVDDTPMLIAANVGVALGAEHAAATKDPANILIMSDTVERLATAYEIAQRTFKIARLTILVGITVSLALMLLFATGKLSPLTGAILQAGVDVGVIFGALRAHAITPATN